jgi:hypothetical protein
MRSTCAAFVGAATLAASLAACSANNNPICTTVPLKNVAIPQLIYPVSGYDHVPVSAPAMVVAYPADPALAQTITLTPPHSAPIALGPLGAAPKVIPTPHAQVLPGQGALYGVTMPALKAKTHYGVAYRYATTAGLCGQSTTASVSMGGFTTQ